jgi:hypothetical protein
VFYECLQELSEKFTRVNGALADDLMARLYMESKVFFEQLRLNNSNTNENKTTHHESIIIPSTICTSLLRSLKYQHTKVLGIDLLLRFASVLSDFVTMDRILPYMVCLFVF